MGLVDAVRLGMAARALARADVREVAQRLWASVHGAVSPELRGTVFADARVAVPSGESPVSGTPGPGRPPLLPGVTVATRAWSSGW